MIGSYDDMYRNIKYIVDGFRSFRKTK